MLDGWTVGQLDVKTNKNYFKIIFREHSNDYNEYSNQTLLS